MKKLLALMAVVVLSVASGTSADVTLFDFANPQQIDEWHGEMKTEAVRGGMVVRFDRTLEPVWSCWSFPQNWEEFDRLVVTFDVAERGRFLALAVSDDEGYTVGTSFLLKEGANEISVPVRKLFEGGLQTRYVRGIALWYPARAIWLVGKPEPHPLDAPQNAAPVTIRNVRLTGKGGDLSTCVRFGQRMLDDAERRNSNYFWYYAFEARRTKVVEEHAAAGKRCFMLDFLKPGVVSSYGRFAHDWRGYEALAFDVFNPKDKPVTLTVELKDTWIAFFSRAYVSSHEFTLAPNETTQVTVALAGLEGKQGGRGALGRLNLEYMQQIVLKVADDACPVKLYVDDVRLVGKPGSAFEDGGALTVERTGEIPKFGFETSRETLKLPGDLRNIPLTGPIGRLKAGAARVKVTPKVGTRLASSNAASEGILDDVYVRVLLLQEEGRDLVAWLHIDNLYMPGRQEVPPLLAEKLGVKPENIFWSATHNHNCGAPWASKVFTQQIIDGFVQAAGEARARMKPVRVGIATTQAKFNFNRVMKGPDGNYYSTLDAKYMRYLEDSRPTDTELATLWFVAADGAPVAGVVYYTGHANMLCRVMPWISGDWPGWTEHFLEEASGAVVMHVQGPLGDVDMRDICISYGRTIRAGWDVAYASMGATRRDLVAVDPAVMAGVSVRHAVGEGTPAKEGGAKQQLGVHVLTIGPVAFCDLSGEAWTRFGLDLRAKSPYPHTYLNFSSGYYYPEAWAFEKKAYGSAGRQPDWGPVLVETALGVLREAAAGK